MQYTRLHAAQLLAAALGSASQDAAYFLCGWSAHEIGATGKHPQNNLWAVAKDRVFGTPDYNSAGVDNYATLSIGITATVTRLHNGLYQGLLDAIVTGNFNSQGVRQSLHNWRVGPNSNDWSGYESQIGSFINDGKAHAGDTFNESGSNSSGGTGTETSVSKCNHGQSCIIGQPLGCPTGWTCYAVDDNGCIDLTNALAVTGFCFNCSGTDCAQEQFSGTKAGTTSNFVPAWLQNPDWQRVLKFILGLFVTGFGLLLVYQVLSGNNLVQSVKKAAVLAA